MPEITEEVVKKLIEVIDCGLISGLGKPNPGEMCVEAAVCFALGLPHGDEPDCVDPVLRAFKITLNDANWSSNEARAKGLRKLALLQLGSKNKLDRTEFSSRIAIAIVNKILPIVLEPLGIDTTKCEQSATLADAAADAAAAAAATTARAATARAATAAVTTAAWAASAAADATAAAWAASAAAAATAAAADSDSLLLLSAELAANILIDLKVPGCKWLYLLEE